MVEDNRKRGRQKRTYIDDIKEWTKMDINVTLDKVQHREEWRTTCFDDSILISPKIFESRE